MLNLNKHTKTKHKPTSQL